MITSGSRHWTCTGTCQAVRIRQAGRETRDDVDGAPGREPTGGAGGHGTPDGSHRWSEPAHPDPVGPGTVGASRVTIAFPSCSQSVAAAVTAEVTITKGVFPGSGGLDEPGDEVVTDDVGVDAAPTAAGRRILIRPDRNNRTRDGPSATTIRYGVAFNAASAEGSHAVWGSGGRATIGPRPNRETEAMTGRARNAGAHGGGVRVPAADNWWVWYAGTGWLSVAIASNAGPRVAR